MIVYRQWQKKTHRFRASAWAYEGWFLFGIIPLYIRRHGYKPLDE